MLTHMSSIAALVSGTVFGDDQVGGTDGRTDGGDWELQVAKDEYKLSTNYGTSCAIGRRKMLLWIYW